MKLKLRITLILVFCLLMVFSFAIYFNFSQLNQKSSLQRLHGFPYPKVKSTTHRINGDNDENAINLTITSVATVAGIKINRKLQTLNFTVEAKSSKFQDIFELAENNFKVNVAMKVSPWNLAASWVKPHEIHAENTPELGYILHSMATNSITHAGVGFKGTQLKMMLKLNGGQEAIFKPMRYERDFVITGLPYAGADRHNGEIAAFHLNRLLGLCTTPLTVGRAINLKSEVMPVASESLAKTFFNKDNNTCFYGQCYYCSPGDPACAKGDVIEGAVILMLPDNYRLKKYRSPWQRTYKDSVIARWEQDFNYCEQIKKINLYKRGRRLLDLIESSIFDYLIGNADRHHYEVFADFPDSAVILLDNGKSFGNPYWDELTILAPLYQCCSIRKSFYERLWAFVDRLGQALREILIFDHLSPILSPPHLESLDRRLKTVLAAIEVCFDDYGEEKVIVTMP